VAEIWAFVNSRGDLVVHRCAGRRDGRRVFVGDANPGRDELVDDDLLVGRITMVHSGAARRRPTRLAGLAPLLGWSGRSVLRRVMRHHAE